MISPSNVYFLNEQGTNWCEMNGTEDAGAFWLVQHTLP